MNNDFKIAADYKMTRSAVKDCPGITIKDLQINRPDGALLINPFSLTLSPGDRMMISGPSGCGKSTILRAAHGLWLWGNGQIETNPDMRRLIIAQKPHLPLTSLKGIVCFPDFAASHSDEDVAAALTAVGLEKNIPDMNDDSKDGSYWERLSGGEKQRISFARALLIKPDILMLDEVTASLDVKAQDELYGILLKKLPDTILVSISHRPELQKFHNRLASIDKQTLTVTSLADTVAKPDAIHCPVCNHPHYPRPI